MTDDKLRARIKKRCLALAKDLLRDGPHLDLEKGLIVHLVQKAFESPLKTKTARDAYTFYLQNNVGNDLAWAMSGLGLLVPEGPREETHES